MDFSYDLERHELTFCIGDFPSDIQQQLESTLDINGFIGNEPKFKKIVADNLTKLPNVSPKIAEDLYPIVIAGNLLTLERDAEKNQFGLNFKLNKYLFSLDVVPGKPEIKEGTLTLAVLAIAKNNEFYITAFEDEDGNYRYAGRVKPFLAREPLFAEPVDEDENLVWVDPKKFKKLLVKHQSLEFSSQNAYDTRNGIVLLGKKFSAVAAGLEVIGLSEETASLSQVTKLLTSPAAPAVREIQRIAKDEGWQQLRSDLHWTPGTITESLSKLRQYLGASAERNKKVRVLNLLNGVTRTGILTQEVVFLQRSLSNQLGIQAAVATFKEGDRVNFKNIPVLNPPASDASDSEKNEYDFLKDVYTELKAAGSGTVESIAITNVYGTAYWVRLDGPVPGTPGRKVIVREENLTPAMGTMKFPTVAPLSPEEKEKMLAKIKELEKTDPQKARRLYEKHMEKEAAYEWTDSPLKGGVSKGRLNWLPHAVATTRLFKKPWDATPLTSGDLYLLKLRVQKGQAPDDIYRKELSYYNEWHSDKWDAELKERIIREVLERAVSFYQVDNPGKLPPIPMFLSDHFPIGSWVFITEGEHKGKEGEVVGMDVSKGTLDVLLQDDTEPTTINKPFEQAKKRGVGRPSVPSTEPEAPKRENVMEELHKVLSNFQPGMWHAIAQFQPGLIVKLVGFLKGRIANNFEFPNVASIKEHLGVSESYTYVLLRELLARARIAATGPEGQRQLLQRAPMTMTEPKQEAPAPAKLPTPPPPAEGFGRPGRPSVMDRYRSKFPLPDAKYQKIRGELDSIGQELLDGFQKGEFHPMSYWEEKGITRITIYLRQKKILELMLSSLEKTAIFRMCAYCQNPLVPNEVAPFENKRTSHGICEACALKYFGLNLEELRKEDEEHHKEAGFMPSMSQQPFWNQHPDGATGDYALNQNVLSPLEWWDTWNAYTQQDDKTNPEGFLHNILKKFMPLSKKETDEQTPLTKSAILHRDPSTSWRYDTITRLPLNTEFGDVEATLIDSPSGESIKYVPYGTPAEQLTKDKKPVIEVPQEGEKAPTNIIFGPSAPVHTSPNLGKKFYKLTLKSPELKGRFPIGVIDADYFFSHLSHAVKKGEEKAALTEWLTTKVQDKKKDINELISLAKKEEETGKRSPKTPLLQAVISDNARAVIEILQGLPPSTLTNKETADVFGQLVADAKKEGKFKQYLQLLDIAKTKFKLGVATKPEVIEQYKILADGPTAQVGTTDYDQQAKMVLYGEGKLPPGSVDAKRKVIRNMSSNALLAFISSAEFEKQPFGVQSQAVRRASNASSDEAFQLDDDDVGQVNIIGSPREKALLSVWDNKDLPATLRAEALKTLVLAYGIGITKGTAEGDSTDSLLTKASNELDANVRALAIQLATSPKVGYLPWTNEGELSYSKETNKSRKDQPVRAYPDWFINVIRNEPVAAIRGLAYKVIDELPADLVKEETPGHFTFTSPETLPGLEKFVIEALNDPDPRIQRSIRNHFKLANPIAPKKDKEEVKMEQPSASYFIETALKLLQENKLQDAMTNVVSASKAHDAAEWKKQILDLRKKVDEALKKDKDRSTQEEKLKASTAKLLEIHPDFKDSARLLAFLNWVAQLKKGESYEAQSLANKNTILDYILSDNNRGANTLFDEWTRSTPAEDVAQPKLPLEEEERDENEGMEKRAAPLSAREIVSRQPPTTWPLSNPQVGYSAAVPIAPKDDDLLLKDVRQYIGRPTGKWQSLLGLVYDMLFKMKDEDEKLEKIAAEIPSDEAGLLKMVQTTESKSVMRQALAVAVDKNLPTVVDAIFENGSPDIKAEALKGFFTLKYLPGLQKALERDVPLPLQSAAVKYLIDLGLSDDLKKVFKTADENLQRAIVHNLGDQGDKAFLKEALSNKNASVRNQAIAWLAYHHEFAALKQHLLAEKDQTVKDAINKVLAQHKDKLDAWDVTEQGEGKVEPLLPVSEAFEKFTPEEQKKHIDDLVKTAQDAFTLWQKYPAIRSEVLGRRHERFGIQTEEEWKEAQPEIDQEIEQIQKKYPTMAQGDQALRELKAIVAKLPSIDKEIRRLEDWIKEAEVKYEKSQKDGASEKALEMYRNRIDTTKAKLASIYVPAKDLENIVKQLEILGQETKWRQTLAEDILKDKKFVEKFGPEAATWKQYAAWQKTFEPVAPRYVGSRNVAEQAKAIEKLEKDRAELADKYAEPVREDYVEEGKKMREISKELEGYYKKFRSQGIRSYYDANGRLMPWNTRELQKKLAMYEKMAENWFKLVGDMVPYAEIDDVKYTMIPALWKTPSDAPTPYGVARGKVLIGEQPGILKVPVWGEAIDKANKELDAAHEKFMKELNSKLPPEAKALQDQYKLHMARREQLLARLKRLGVYDPDTGFLQYEDLRKKLADKKKVFDEARLALIKRVRAMGELDPKSPEFIKLKKDLKDFQGQYGVRPYGDSPEDQVVRQFQEDKWKNPKQPLMSPILKFPEGKEPKPWSGRINPTPEPDVEWDEGVPFGEEENE